MPGISKKIKRKEIVHRLGPCEKRRRDDMGG
jgi:hypothetical protein